MDQMGNKRRGQRVPKSMNKTTSNSGVVAKSRHIAMFFLLITLAVFLFSFNSNKGAEEGMTYSDLRNVLKTGHINQIEKVRVINGDGVIQVRMAGINREKSVVVPTELKQKLLTELDEAGVALEAREPDTSG